MSDLALDDEPDFYNLIAHERGMPEGWRWYQLEARPKFWAGNAPDRSKAFCLVRGAVCTAVVARGPRKGNMNWKKRDRSTDTEIAISFTDLDARIAKWRSEHPKAVP